MLKTIFASLGLFAGAMALELTAFAISSTDQIAWPNKPVVAEKHWPSGVLEIMNDPTRQNGWHPWFSEWPNDVNYYELNANNVGDLKRLIEKLAAINASKVQVLLNPAREAGPLAFTASVEKGISIAAVFSIGNQEVIDQWFGRLEKQATGTREFGVYRLEKPPEALPPTLTLYVGHPTVDLAKLNIPESVQVIADVPKWIRDEHKEEVTVKRIDDFVAKRPSTKTTPALDPFTKFLQFPDESVTQIRSKCWKLKE